METKIWQIVKTKSMSPVEYQVMFGLQRGIDDKASFRIKQSPYLITNIINVSIVCQSNENLLGDQCIYPKGSSRSKGCERSKSYNEPQRMSSSLSMLVSDSAKSFLASVLPSEERIHQLCFRQGILVKIIRMIKSRKN